MQNTQHLIKTEAQLRQLIPAYPKLLDKRIQQQLDHYSLEFIELSQLAVLYIHTQEAECSSFYYVTPEQWKVQHPHQLELPTLVTSPVQASLLFLIPGIDHLLRINGVLEAHSSHHTGSNRLKINQVYFHCGRAAMRSELWSVNNPPTQAINSTASLSISQFCQQARYALLATSGSSDTQQAPLLSPRGEPQGMFYLRDDHTLIIPDRPGNKIAASLRNLLDNPAIKVLLLVPGRPEVLEVHGNAYLSHDPDLLANTETQGKQARLAIMVDIDWYQIRMDKNLQQADIWNKQKQRNKNELTSFSKALSAHINGTGIMGKMTHLVVDQVVKKDAKNLY